jgi:hypothetical protein
MQGDMLDRNQMFVASCCRHCRPHSSAIFSGLDGAAAPEGVLAWSIGTVFPPAASGLSVQ